MSAVLTIEKLGSAPLFTVWQEQIKFSDSICWWHSSEDWMVATGQLWGEQQCPLPPAWCSVDWGHHADTLLSLIIWLITAGCWPDSWQLGWLLSADSWGDVDSGAVWVTLHWAHCLSRHCHQPRCRDTVPQLRRNNLQPAPFNETKFWDIRL